MTDLSSKDLLGTHSTECAEGEYQETTIYDDCSDTLHPTQCNHKIKRDEIKRDEVESRISE